MAYDIVLKTKHTNMSCRTKANLVSFSGQNVTNCKITTVLQKMTQKHKQTILKVIVSYLVIRN